MPVFLDPTRRQPVFGTPVEVVIDDGWPEPHHVARPRDELGQRIIDFANQWRGHPNLQESPWDDRTGTINLVPPDEVRPATDPLPTYRVLEAAAFIGCVLYLKDQVVPFAGWVVNPWTVEAANESAALVLAYQTKYGTDRKLAGQPHQSGRLFFWNPALVTSPISPVLRWAGGNAA
jgi:hypothetical protein